MASLWSRRAGRLAGPVLLACTILQACSSVDGLAISGTAPVPADSGAFADTGTSTDDGSGRAASDAAASAPVQSPPGKAKATKGAAEDVGESRDPAPDTLAGVVARAVSDSPKILLAEAKSAEAQANVGVARSGYFPILQGSVGSGHALNGAYGKDDLFFFDSKKAMGSWLTQASLTGRQLLFDFGATSQDVARARATLDAEQLRVIGTAEDIAFDASRAYLSVLEKRELLALAKANLVALRDLARLVEENQKAGNGTLADVKRVGARVVEAENAEGDQTFELQNAVDTFRRLARLEPGPLKSAPSLDREVPETDQAAIRQAFETNPAVLASVASVKARRAEIESVRAADLPKLTVESDIIGKNYRQLDNRVELESRNLVTLRYSFLDGGRRSSQIDAAGSRLAQEEASLRDQRESLEADIRRYFWVRRNASQKEDSLRSGVDDSKKARELYREQFSGGRRTLLELLDVQSSAYNSERNLILNKYEARRATYGILHALGRLIPAAIASGPKG